MIELITGHGSDNHISSNDFRAFNRANFGQGRYILKDENNMAVTVSAATGNISIASGSCMWSGMHIRLASAESLTYVVPTTTQTVGVYLHYNKNTDTLVESVEIKAFVGSAPSPIVDTLSDNTTEAYTLLYSFSASSTEVTNAVYAFKFAKSNDEIESLIEEANSETILFSGSAALNSSITLTESFRNFRELVFYVGSDFCGRVLASDISGGNIDVPTFGAAKWSNTNDTYLRIATARLSITSETKLQYTNGQYIIIGSAIAEQDKLPIMKIKGIGRIA